MQSYKWIDNGKETKKLFATRIENTVRVYGWRLGGIIRCRIIMLVDISDDDDNDEPCASAIPPSVEPSAMNATNEKVSSAACINNQVVAVEPPEHVLDTPTPSRQ